MGAGGPGTGIVSMDAPKLSEAVIGAYRDGVRAEHGVQLGIRLAQQDTLFAWITVYR